MIAPLRSFCRIQPACLLLLLCLFCAALPISAAAKQHEVPLDFSLFRMGTGDPLMLIVGGIQGDEPGGFSAATLIATRYKVTKGGVWVVPNLNFPSIIRRSRGVHGDMNRKFAVLDEKDPQYAIVSRIQKLIRHEDVCLVLNLHDGSGFYRPQYEDALHSPKRWGQSIIIDQATMPEPFVPTPYMGSVPALEHTAEGVVNSANAHILKEEHRLHVHNTRTAQGDKEMEKSLSWFAVRHGKPAFGVEASKEFSVEMRVFYHLLMIEAFAEHAGIGLERDFPLTIEGVREALYSDLSVTFAGGRITLPLDDVRTRINFLPLPLSQPQSDAARGKMSDGGAITSKPIMAVLPHGKELRVHYGNRTLTRISPDWHTLDTSLDALRVTVDGAEKRVTFGQIIPVRQSFLVQDIEGYRVNAIGADTGRKNESDVTLRKKNFIPRFSVDKSARIFRIEVYKGKAFCGLFLVRFVE